MHIVPSQAAICAAIKESNAGLKWWIEVLGGIENISTISHWAHNRRVMPVEMRAKAFDVLAENFPELAADLLRDILRPYRLTCEPLAKPEALTIRHTYADWTRETADVHAATAEAYIDGDLSDSDLMKLIEEQRQSNEKGETHLHRMESDLAARLSGPRPARKTDDLQQRRASASRRTG